MNLCVVCERPCGTEDVVCSECGEAAEADAVQEMFGIVDEIHRELGAK